MFIIFALLTLLQSDRSFVVSDRPFIITEVAVHVPKKQEVKQVEVAVKKPYILMYSSPSCGPCNSWKANEKAKVLNAGIEIRDSPDYNGINSIPAFKLFDSTGKQVGNTIFGYTNSSSPSNAANLISKLKTKSYYTRDQIYKWIHDTYNKGDQFERGVMASGSSVYQHLVNDHGWKPEQVNSLPQWEAEALHDASHPKLNKNKQVISPPLIQPYVESFK